MKRVSMAKAKAQLSALVNAVAYGGEHIVIESRGTPKAVLVAANELEHIGTTRFNRPTKAQRALALHQADRLRKALRNLALTDSVAQLGRLRRNRAHGLS